MKNIAIFILCSCIFLSGCFSMAVTGANAIYNHHNLQNTASDYYIEIQSKHAIDSDPELLNHTNISVTCFNRIVLLTGRADNEMLRQHAADLIKTIPNLLKIYNAIRVRSPISVMQETKDTWITTKIKAKLIANNNIEPNKIKVITVNSEVYLLGIIPQKQAEIAINIASHTDGVKHVIAIFYYIIMPTI